MVAMGVGGEGEVEGEGEGEVEGVLSTPFRDRRDAGQRLGAAVRRHLLQHPPAAASEAAEAIVIALPRGGVLVGAEVARAIAAPLDIWIVRKIGVPGHEELGLGAVAEGGAVYLSAEIVALAKISRDDLALLIEQKRAEVQRRTQLFRAERLPPGIAGKVVILVDDGIATGGTIRAVARALRTHHPRRLVLAAPIAAADTAEALSEEVDDIICLETPPVLHAVGAWYEDFRQVPDAEVVAVMEAFREAFRHERIAGAKLSKIEGRS
jgi:putative phosphoribosyl transferase